MKSGNREKVRTGAAGGARGAGTRRPGRRTTAAGKLTLGKAQSVKATPDERIYLAVFNAVMSHRLPPGTKITEQSLCELFKVSRTIVRKVLQRLAHERILELRPNRGASVASPPPEETREIFAARRIVESAIIPLVVARATPGHIARLRRHIRGEYHALAEGDRSTWIRLTGEFHLELAELAGNRTLARFLTELVSRCSLIIALYDSPLSVPCAEDEHEELIKVIAAGDSARACRLMDQHLLAIERRLQLQEKRDTIDLAKILIAV